MADNLYTALRNAHNAGDDDAAKRIAAMIKASDQPSVEDAVPFDFSASEMVSNVPRSAANLAGGLLQTVTSPVETAKGFGRMASGGLYKANQLLAESAPEWMSFMGKPIGGGDQVFGQENAPAAEQLAAAMVDRYGSIENAKRTLQEDPVGAMADLAGVIGGVGSAARAPMLTKAGAAINPINVAANTAKYASGKIIPKALPRSLYQRGTKFSTTYPKAERAQMTETALREGIMPTSRGLDKISDKISSLDDKLMGFIQRSTESGDRVPVGRVLSEVRKFRKAADQPVAGVEQKLKSIDRIIDSQIKAWQDRGITEVSANELQTLKRALDKDINWRSRSLQPPIRGEALKEVRRGARREIEGLTPEARDLNKQMSELIKLQEGLDRPVSRIENRNPIGIQAPMNIGAGGVAGGAPGVAAGVGLSLLESPRVATLLALKAENLRKVGLDQFLKNNPNISQAELAAILAGRQELQ